MNIHDIIAERVFAVAKEEFDQSGLAHFILWEWAKDEKQFFYVKFIIFIYMCTLWRISISQN